MRIGWVIQGTAASFGSRAPPTGPMSTRQRKSPTCPDSAPGTSSVRGGIAVANTPCAVCISVTWSSKAFTPRTLVDITDPIATIETATTASATSTSTIVKPASDRSIGARRTGDNLDPSSQPVDADFIGHIEPGEGDGAPARHSVGEKTDGGQHRALLAGPWQQGIEAHVVGN